MSNYVDSWKPTSSEIARKQILSGTDSYEVFVKSGIEGAKFISRYLKKEFEVLDYGCGIGRIAKPLSNYVNKIYGVDISKEMLTFAKDFCKDCNNIHFKHTEGTTIPLENSTIDFAYSILTLQHVEREDAFLILQEMNRVLKNHAKLYITLQNILSEEIWNTFQKLATERKHRVPHRVRMYTFSEAEMFLSKAGFRIVEKISHPDSDGEESNLLILAEKV